MVGGDAGGLGRLMDMQGSEGIVQVNDGDVHGGDDDGLAKRGR